MRQADLKIFISVALFQKGAFSETTKADALHNPGALVANCIPPQQQKSISDLALGPFGVGPKC